ncbi:hypothetical protein [Aerococcus urinae]|uniref:Enoyl-CoA hydratase n=1 Tax=Aerococcus urinae TaxID=1376 RepID=A0A0X8FDQ6_9LACT|nr:hypothetical protein [Aerococcus urinae]AMB95461.1 hypothetical protein AWM73_02495 [Aerococcus urinae]MCY3037983.1 hypothetical protein [Aerococcus urinae]MCY3049701.1 hypothetical protein [Aerococcus urinae]MCY3051774.1 hypothetical protein [Aerococcus urinae]MCY3053135.1 hypothetical protein [Aerococcus urinae]
MEEKQNQKRRFQVGDTFSTTESFRERDIMLYMGVTDDHNPLYLPGREGAQIPPIALIGAVTRTVSGQFPGPNSDLVELNFTINNPIYHHVTLTFHFEILRVDELKGYLTIHVITNNETTGEKNVMDAMITVLPQYMDH